MISQRKLSRQAHNKATQKHNDRKGFGSVLVDWKYLYKDMVFPGQDDTSTRCAACKRRRTCYLPRPQSEVPAPQILQIKLLLIFKNCEIRESFLTRTIPAIWYMPMYSCKYLSMHSCSHIRTHVCTSINSITLLLSLFYR